MIKIRANGEVFNEVENPSIVVDIVEKENEPNEYIMMKIGEKENMQDYYNLVLKRYKENGFENQINLAIIDLPRNQELVDRVFQTTGYLSRVLKDVDFNDNNFNLANRKDIKWKQ